MVNGVANEQTRTCLMHWINEAYRCPVVVTARTGDGYASVYDGGAVADGADPENLWGHDDVQSPTPRVFAVDFTERYDMPDGGGSGTSDFTRDKKDFITLGERNALGGYEGPVLKDYHAWDEAEMTPQRLTGTAEANLSEAESSTYKVIRAVADIECNGYFDSLNAYDNAVLSAGPFHWTLAVFYNREGEARDQISEGELCAFLAYLQSEYPDTYEQFFGMDTFGIRPSEEWGRNGENLFDPIQRTYTTTLERRMSSSEGAVGTETMPLQLENMSIEEAETEWLYFRNWHWFYRFVMASRVSEDFQEACWDFARLRLPAILEAGWPEAPSGSDWSNLDWTSDATVGDVFTSEKAVAMLLRWHVFRPLHMSAEAPKRHRKIEDIFEIARNLEAHLAWEQDPIDWGDEHEQALMDAIEDQAQKDDVWTDGIDEVSNNDNLSDARAGSFDIYLEDTNINIAYL